MKNLYGNNFSKALFLKGALLTVLFIVLVGCTTQSGESNEETTFEIPVHVETIKLETVGNTHKYMGSFNPHKENVIYAKVTGELNQIYVQKGDQVTEGQQLALIDDSDLSNQIKQAQTQVDNAKANLEQGKLGYNSNLLQAQISVDNVSKNLEESKKQVAHLESLKESGAISENELEQAKNALHQAENAYLQAKNQLEVAENKANITFLEAMVKQAETSLQSVLDHAKDVTIVSPIDGEIVEINVEVGELVSPQAPFIRVINRDQMIFSFQVYEEDLFLLKKGMETNINIPSLEQNFVGEIQYVGLTPIPNTKSFPVEAIIDNKDHRLFPGLLGEAEIKTDIKEALTIPTEALVEQGGLTYAYVVRDNKAHLQEITVQNLNNNTSILLSGLQAGDQVITKGKFTATDGATVRIVGGNSQ